FEKKQQSPGACRALRNFLLRTIDPADPQSFPEACYRLFGFGNNGHKYLEKTVSHNLSDQQIEWTSIAFQFFRITTTERESIKILTDLKSQIALTDFGQFEQTSNGLDPIWVSPKRPQHVREILRLLKEHGCAAIIGRSATQRRVLLRDIVNQN